VGHVATLSDARVEPARASRRDALNGWFVTHEVAWELAMAAMAIVYVALGFIVDDLQPGERPEIEAAELAMTGLFVLEFASRFLAARSRSGYLRGHWIDVIALGPPIRALRVLRLLRLLRLVRAFAGLYRAGLHLHGLANHKGFAWLLSAWLGVMVLCSAWMYIAEKGINKAVENPFDALWWGVGTLTTAGYGDVYPQTTEGRLAAMALMLLGIGLFGAITATITSYSMSHDLNRVESKIDADAAVDRSNLALDQATQRTKATVGGTAESPSAAGGSLVDELERLAALYRSGDLTSDEFTAAKQQALGRPPIDRPVGLESPAAE
jgi:voltage-gated potassium channel